MAYILSIQYLQIITKKYNSLTIQNLCIKYTYTQDMVESMNNSIDVDTEEKKRGPKGPSKALNDKDFMQLLNMIRIQCTQTECCNVLGMSDTTLNRRLRERGYENFEDLYKKHNDEGKMSLRRMQWQAAENGNATMLVWLGKQYLSQRDRLDAELTGKDGGAIVTKIERVIVDPSNTNT